MGELQTLWAGIANIVSHQFGQSSRLRPTRYYGTWIRIDPLVFVVALAAIEKFRPAWWQRLMNLAPLLWLPGLALIVCALSIGESDDLTVITCVWQFTLIALGMAALLFCAVSPRCPSVASKFLEPSSPASPRVRISSKTGHPRRR